LTGSSLRGSCDPKRDRLRPAERQKLEHLDKLERRGFDVAALKDAVLEDTKKKRPADFEDDFEGL